VHTSEVVEALSVSSGCGADVHQRLETLRTRVATLDPDGTVERALSDVSKAVERLAVENTGMAEELLSAYEQLGIIFEVTRKLPGVHGESEVIDLFIDSLRHNFQEREVFAAHPRRPVHGLHTEAPWSCEDWFEHFTDRARDSASVLVECPPVGAVPVCVAEVMAGPVFAGDSFVYTIVLTHGANVETFRAGDMLLLESLTKFCGDLIRNHRLSHELGEMSIAMVRSLVNAVDQKDAYTSGHSLRVGYFATLLGRALNLGDEDLQMLQWSALLHDVGKIGIRDDVLKKKGELTDEEFDHIKEHPVRSHRVVQKVPQLVKALDGVLHHHERFDGTGYPTGLSGEDIPLQARIIQIADVFDALTSDRAYRPAYTWGKALDILNDEAGKTVDPRLREVFDRLIREALGDDPSGWEKMVQRAKEFAQDDVDHPVASDGG